MKSIEQVIRETAERMEGYTYIYETWEDADMKLEKLAYPAIVCVMPTSGNTTIRNGRIYDEENVAIAFLTLVPRNAEGEDNGKAINEMKVAGAKFFDLLNKSGELEPVTQLPYEVVCEQLSSIVSGVIYQPVITQRIGYCPE